MSVEPRHFLPGDGKTFKRGQLTMTFKTGAADTAGAFTLCEAVEPPDAGAGLHRHQSYDETFIICEGRYEFRIGQKTLTVGPGETLFAPRGTLHAYRSLGPETGRQFTISSPGGVFDTFIAEIVAAQVASGSPPFRAIAAKYGIEFPGVAECG